MNCKVFFRILAISTVVLISASAYAAEDHLNISPSTLDMEKGIVHARSGRVDVTISGERNSDKVIVMDISYSVSPFCMEGIYGCTFSLVVNAVIREGDVPGKSNYEEKMPVYLAPGTYSVSLFISESLSGEYKHIDINPGSVNPLYLYVSENPIPINIENITGAAITGSDTFTLEGITVPGYAETFWGTFKWNPGALSFDLMDAGVGTGVNR